MKTNKSRHYRHRSGILLTKEYFLEREKWLYKRYLELHGMGHHAKIAWLVVIYGGEFKEPYRSIERIIGGQEELLQAA